MKNIANKNQEKKIISAQAIISEFVSIKTDPNRTANHHNTVISEGSLDTED